MRFALPLLLLLASGSLCRAQTTYTATLPASSGQVVFTLTTDRPEPGPSVACPIGRSGTVSCTVAALRAPREAYRVCVQAGGIQPGVCFFSQVHAAQADLLALMPADAVAMDYAKVLPPGCVAGTVCRSRLQAPGSAPRPVQVAGGGLGDLGAALMAQQRGLPPGQHAVFAIDKPGTIASAVTLQPGNGLVLGASVTLAANVTLAGGNRVSCTPAAMLQFAPGISFVGVGDDLAITGCTGRSEPTPTQDLFASEGSSHVLLAHNTLHGMGLMRLHGGSDYAVTDNAVVFSTGVGVAALWGGDASWIQVVRNRFEGGAAGTEYFNRDSDPAHGGPTTLPPIAAGGGHYLLAENTCTHAGACFWGSSAHHVAMLNNYAEACGDVCFDFEGSTDSVAAGNRGNDAATSLGAVFFTSDHILFQGNLFANAVGGGIRIFNSSRAPAQSRFLTVLGNLLQCTAAICAGVGGDPSADLTITDNHLLNARLDLGNFGGNTTIRGNELLFTESSPRAFTAVQAPDLLNGASLDVAGNRVIGTPNQPDGSICIASNSSDFNSSVRLRIAGNTCHANLSLDLRTANAGGNPGTSVTTVVSGNQWQYGRTQHTHPGANHDLYSEGKPLIR